ncbi:hypothetical protein [Maribacter antarcticus]|uniref:hypothetical protein n=1 Tax=Maribacter antarcticus TaxID=505250 RepID=UPI00047924A1|nr:hypothetical protein [Maribacter antarcticus]
MDEQILNIIIGAIIVIQIVVFAVNIARIWFYKQAIGNIDNYTIKHSNIPEEYIEQISVREILSNNIPESLKSAVLDDEKSEEVEIIDMASDSEDKEIDFL